MPKLIPVQTITVGREGKTVVPPIGQPFDFTDQEAKEIAAMNPAAVRKPIVEVEAVEQSGEQGEPAAPAAKATGGKKKADPEL